MNHAVLIQAIHAVPPGHWGIGVSGGADSVSLLRLMQQRADIQPHVVHMDHQTRAGESQLDAEFVTQLAKQFDLPCTVGRRSEFESTDATQTRNISTRYRKARLALFKSTVDSENLQGMLLAHHQDDQVETILMRLIRGASPDRLGGIRMISPVNGMLILRPLLEISSSVLKMFLQQLGQSWREDSSNDSDQYQRNRLRHWLQDDPALRDSALKIGTTSAKLNDWLEQAAPRLEASFKIDQLNRTAKPLANRAAARWLQLRGAPPEAINLKVCEQLIEMACDVATASRQMFPGKIIVRRRKNIISVD